MVNPDQGNIFAGANVTIQAPAQDEPKPAQQVPTELAEYVGEGKKYSSVEDALRSVPHAQSHIAQLQQELATLRETVTEQTEELKKRANAETMITEMNQQRQPAKATPEPIDVNAVIQAATQAAVKATKDEQLAIQHANNQKAVNDKMVEVHGSVEAAAKAVATKAAEMDVPVKYLQDIASSKPKMFWTLMGGEQEAVSHVPAKSSGMQPLEAVAGNNQALQKPTKSVLAGATTAEVVAEWKRCGELIKQEGNN